MGGQLLCSLSHIYSLDHRDGCLPWYKLGFDTVEGKERGPPRHDGALRVPEGQCCRDFSPNHHYIRIPRCILIEFAWHFWSNISDPKAVLQPLSWAFMKEMGKRRLLQGVPEGTVTSPRPPHQLGPSWEAVDIWDICFKTCQNLHSMIFDLGWFSGFVRRAKEKGSFCLWKSFLWHWWKNVRWTLLKTKKSQIPGRTCGQQATLGRLELPSPGLGLGGNFT